MNAPATTADLRQAAFSPIDDAARRVIRDELEETLFVEASAGTGKTASLVARVVNLVLTGKTTLDRIAAITFTEAAAAELRDRVRQGLEEAAASDSRDAEERDRCRQGLVDLDQAAIQTLHSFASALLHERPLEARLPPSFETTDEIAAGIKFNEAWDTWLDGVLEADSDLAPHLALALTLRMTLTQLKDVALAVHRNYADLSGVTFAAPPGTPSSRIEELQQAQPELERLCHYSKLQEDDLLYRHVQSKLGVARRLAEARPGSPIMYRLLLQILPLKYGRGKQGDWETDPESGINACKVLKALLGELQEAATVELDAARRAVMPPILNGLREFVLRYAAQRRTEGRAEFHDLLIWARDLLRDDLSVRDHFRRRFSHVLIDEVQDTDPIQTEIAMFLSEHVPDGQAANSRPTAWDQIVPERGKLFVVGDPKQSIYRFRRADVVQMNQLRARMEQAGGRAVSLVQNFRSQQAIVSWVNHLFQHWMEQDREQSGKDGYFQAHYEPMSPRWSGDTGAPFGPRVWALADLAVEGPIDAVRKQEAQELARLLRQMVDGRWQTLDRQTAEATGRETYRPVKFSDICILKPSRTALWILERELEAQDIPFRLESASLIFETQEIRDLFNCLKAIDDPADQVATVAALRSLAFGCSDADLVRHYDRGGRFDYLQLSGDRGYGPVRAALAALHAFHDARLWESTGGLIDRFVRERGFMEAASGHPRMREQWRRYRFMVEQARQFATAGGTSLRAFLQWVEDQMSERARVTEAPVPEADEEAVRVMTVHAAKGLEFPVVVLTGINSERSGRQDAVLFDRKQGLVEVALGHRNSRFATAGYEELAARERQMSDAEYTRLMYVATTRARDHLVLSLRRPAQRGPKSPAGVMAAHLDAAPALWEPVEPASLSDAPEQDTVAEDQQDGAGETPVAHTLAAREEWVERREQLLDELGRPGFVAATALGSREWDDKDEAESPEPWRRGRGGTSVGRAVHAVLQSIDLATGADIDDRAQAQAAAEGIPSSARHIARLSRAAVDSDIVKRAVASGRFWREVPVALAIGGGSLHGFIDLLFEEAGGLVVVDYKTDAVSAHETANAVLAYRLQGGAYAHGIREVTGQEVKEVVFLYLQPRREERLDDLEQARRDASAGAAALLGTATK